MWLAKCLFGLLPIVIHVPTLVSGFVRIERKKEKKTDRVQQTQESKRSKMLSIGGQNERVEEITA